MEQNLFSLKYLVLEINQLLSKFSRRLEKERMTFALTWVGC